MDLFDCARRVRAGARYLDKLVPGWRKILRRHEEDFDIGDPECCILGTLEHHSKQLRLLNKKRADGLLTEPAYDRAKARLKMHETRAEDLGFDTKPHSAFEDDDWDTLQELWRAEFHA